MLEFCTTELNNLTREDRVKINNFIYENGESTLYHTLEWNEAIKSFTRLQDKILLAYDKSEIVGYFIYFEYPKYFFFKTTNSAIIETPYGGPIARDNDEIILESLILYHEKVSKSLMYYVNTSIKWNSDIMKKLNYETSSKGKEVSLIKLCNNSDEQMISLSKKKRWDINKAIKENVEVSLSSRDVVKEYYSMLSHAFKKFGKTPLPLLFYETLFEKLPEDMLNVYLAKHSGKTLSGMVILKWRKEAYYWNSVSTGESRHLQSTSLLIWRAIENLIDDNYNTLDLLGMSIKPVKEFKISFGGEINSYNSFVKKSTMWRGAKKLTKPFIYFRK